MSTSTEVKVTVKPNELLGQPPMYKVVYLNDDVTTIEFVIDSLVEHFDHGAQTAIQLAEHIHENGSAVVAILPHEIAEQKGIEVTVKAHKHGYPLQIKLESE